LNVVLLVLGRGRCGALGTSFIFAIGPSTAEGLLL
jgi:hypothetical protein